MRPHLKSVCLTVAPLLLALTVPLLPTSSAAFPALAQATQGRKTEVDQLYEQGVQQFRQGLFREAVQTLQQVLTQRRELKDRTGEAQALTQLSEVYYWLNQSQQALEISQSALIIWQELKNRKGEAEALERVGEAYSGLNDYTKSLEVLQQALSVRREVADHAGEGKTLLRIGAIAYKNRQAAKALAALQQAQTILHTEDRFEESLALGWIGWVQFNQGDKVPGSATLVEALNLSREVGNRAAEFNALYFTAETNFQQKEYAKALEFFQQGLPIVQRSGNRSSELYVLKAIANIYKQLGQLENALKTYQQALATVQELKTLLKDVKQLDNIKQLEGSVLTEIGDIYYYQKQYEKFLNFYQQALVVYRELKASTKDEAQLNSIKAKEAEIIYWIGDGYYQQKQYENALGFYQQALAVYRIWKVTTQDAAQLDSSKSSEAYALKAIANTYDQLKQLENALKAYQQALAVYQEIKQNPQKVNLAWEADTLWAIANISYNQKQYENALSFYQQALATYRQSKPAIKDAAQQNSIKNYEAFLLSRIGEIYFQQKEYAKALEFHQQALSIAQQLPNRVREAYTLRAIATTYRRLDQPEKALKLYQQALALFRQEKQNLQESERYAEAFTLWAMANLYFDQKQYETALSVYQQSLIAYLGSPLNEVDVLQAMSFTYGQLGQTEKASKAYQQALERAQLAIATQTTNSTNNTTTIDRELKLDGLWTIDAAKTSANTQYTGTVTISKFEQSYGLLWQTSQGNRSGVALVEDGHLFVGWGEGELSEYGVVAYKIGKDGSLNGRWANSSGYSGTETATGAKPGQIEGNYSIRGTNFNGGRYQGTLEIRKTGDTYQLFWNIGSEYRGVALRSGDYLVVGWGISGTPGAAAYQINGDRAIGHLALLNQLQLNVETLVHNPNAVAQDHTVDVVRLRHEANNLLSVGQPQAAIEKLQQALTIVRTAHDRKREGELLQTLGSVYLKQEQFLKALDTYQQTLIIHREVNNRSGVGATLNSIGLTYHRQGRYTKALEAYQQALAIQEKEGKPTAAAITLSNIGVTYTQQGQYPRALEVYQQALDIQRKEETRFAEGTTLNNMGRTYTEQGQYAKALEVYQQALTSYQKAGESSRRGTTLRNIGLVHANQGDYQKALSSFEEALVIHRAELTKNQFEEAATLSSIGQVASHLGQHSKALESYQYALAVYRKLGYRDAQGNTLSAIGAAYAGLKQYSKALEVYSQALDIHREVGNLPSEITTLSNIGLAYSEMGQYAKALESYQHALVTEQEVESPSRKGRILNNLGKAYYGLKQYSKALESYQQALPILHAVGDREEEGKTLSNLGSLLEVQNQPELAVVFYKQSVNTRETIRQGIRTLSRNQQESYTQTVADTYRTLADLLLSQGRVLEAQQVLELLKVQEIREFNQQTRSPNEPSTELLSPLEKQVIQQYGSLIAFGEKVKQCRESHCPQLGELIAQQGELKQQYEHFVDQFDTEIRQKVYADRAFVDPTQLSQAQELVKVSQERTKKQTILIYPLVLKNRLWLVWVSANNVYKSQPVTVTQGELSQAVVEFRQLMQECEHRICGTADTAKVKTVSQKLYNWLIRPIEPELTKNQVENLIFALDRIVRYIPMAALHDGKQYLIEKYTVSTVLSAGLTKPDARAPFSPQDTKVLGLGVSEKVSPEFAPLPNVPLELSAIIHGNNPNTKGIFPGLEILNQAFNQTTLNTQLAQQQYRIVHIATHGKFVRNNPLASYLLLGTGKPLTIDDIRALPALDNVELVVLSACESALGGSEGSDADNSTLDGIEISSMSYHFLNNHAKTVIASLWQVNDPSTSMLMGELYKSLATDSQQNPMTKAEALRRAQRAMLEGKTRSAPDQTAGNRTVVQPNTPNQPTRTDQPSTADYAHPYYWAPFILIGNGL